ncbi:MAG TPA: hypothetical protein PK154_09105 [Methanoregulaceae archaeon]|nr:hypothetical protein [Methanoregulaceae archaeon]
MTRGKFCSVENLSANAMMPDHYVNAGRGSSILLSEKGKGRLTVLRLVFS